MTQPEQCCGTCRWWENKSRYLGKCNQSVVAILREAFNEETVPDCMDMTVSLMWRDSGSRCPCYEPREDVSE